MLRALLSLHTVGPSLSMWVYNISSTTHAYELHIDIKIPSHGKKYFLSSILNKGKMWNREKRLGL